MSSVSSIAIGISAKTIGDDLSKALRELLEPWPRGEKVQFAVDRAARRAGLPYWRAYNILYRKARVIDVAERAAILEALERKRDEEAGNELHELRVRLAKAEARHAQKDPTFDRKTSYPSRSLDGADGDVGRPVAVRPRS